MYYIAGSIQHAQQDNGSYSILAQVRNYLERVDRILDRCHTVHVVVSHKISNVSLDKNLSRS